MFIGYIHINQDKIRSNKMENAQLKNFNKLFLGLMLVGVLFSNLAFAQSSESGGSATTQTVTVTPHSTRFLGPADQKFIDAAQQYLKQKLGEDYYNKFISFQSGVSAEDCFQNECTIRNSMVFNYIIPFDINSDAGRGPPTPPINIQVEIDNGTITHYYGPKKPYQFLISNDEAIKIAKAYGLVEIARAGYTQDIKLRYATDEYELRWYVSSNDLVGECEDLWTPENSTPRKTCTYKGVYIDVDTGKIIREYNYSVCEGGWCLKQETESASRNVIAPLSEYQFVTVHDIATDLSAYLSKKVQVSGKLINKGNYYMNPTFFITDAGSEFAVDAWAPLEFSPSPPSSPVKPLKGVTMQAYLDKNVTLQGIIVFQQSSYHLQVSFASIKPVTPTSGEAKCKLNSDCVPCGDGCIPSNMAPYAECLEPTHYNYCTCMGGKCKAVSVKGSEKIKMNAQKLIMETSQGDKEIKIMPDTASDVAINQLKLKDYTIELKNVGKPVYEISGVREGRFLGIFKRNFTIKTQVDAETGTVEKTQKPWWGFLVFGNSHATQTITPTPNLNQTKTTVPLTYDLQTDSLNYVYDCSRYQTPNANIPQDLRSKADSLLKERVGDNIFSSFQFTCARYEAGNSSPHVFDFDNYNFYYAITLSHNPTMAYTVSIMLRQDGTVVPNYDFNFPDCKTNPAECGSIISPDKAVAIAKQAGLVVGSKKWFVYFEVRKENFQWVVVSSLPLVPDADVYTIRIDAATGLASQISNYRAVHSPLPER